MQGGTGNGPLKHTWVKDNRWYLAAMCLEGTSKGHLGVFIIEVPHLPYAHQPVPLSSTLKCTGCYVPDVIRICVFLLTGKEMDDGQTVKVNAIRNGI